MSDKGIEQKRKEWGGQLRRAEVELAFLQTAIKPPPEYSSRHARKERLQGLVRKIKFLKLKLERYQ